MMAEGDSRSWSCLFPFPALRSSWLLFPGGVGSHLRLWRGDPGDILTTANSWSCSGSWLGAPWVGLCQRCSVSRAGWQALPSGSHREALSEKTQGQKATSSRITCHVPRSPLKKETRQSCVPVPCPGFVVHMDNRRWNDSLTLSLSSPDPHEMVTRG